MINIDLNYQFSFFGDFEDISPDNSNSVINLLNLFKDDEFVPTIVQEIINKDSIITKCNRFLLQNKNYWSINIGINRIDIVLARADLNEETEFVNITEAYNKAIYFLEKIILNYSKTIFRIALNIDQIYNETNSSKIETKFAKANVLSYYNENNRPFEWNQRLACKKLLEMTNKNKNINVVTNILKMAGILANNEKSIPYTGIITQFDINTEEDNLPISIDDMKAFFEFSITTKNEIEENINGIIE